MILHDHVLHADCYAIRLMAALLGRKLTLQAVDFHPGQQHLTPAFRALNPGCTLPVLQDGDLTLTDSAAMLVHLAQGTLWMPADLTRLQHWLGLSARLRASLGAARLHDMLLIPTDITLARHQGRMALREMEAHLTERRLQGDIFLLREPSIADIACFPHVALAPDGGVTLDDFPSLRLWTRAIRSLPRFIEMPGIPRLHDLSPIANDPQSA